MTMFKKISTLLLVLAGISCTDKEGSMRVLRAAGYRDIKLGGHSWMGCSEDDGASNKFEAVGADGVTKITGQVCCGGPGSFKGCTVRLD